jgi:hypothetical protein
MGDEAASWSPTLRLFLSALDPAGLSVADNALPVCLRFLKLRRRVLALSSSPSPPPRTRSVRAAHFPGHCHKEKDLTTPALGTNQGATEESNVQNSDM